MSEAFLYSTELIGLSVYDLKGLRIGRIQDAAVVPAVHPSRVDRFLVGGGWSWLTIRFDQVRSLSLDGIFLLDEVLTPYHSDEDMLRIKRDLLDQQIIDSHGRKVVRVTDVTFDVRRQGSNDVLYVREVDIGLRSVVRRLLQGAVPPRWVRRLQRRVAPNSISWEACNIIEKDPQRRLRLHYSSARLEQMHPADLADIMEELGPDEREAIIESIDSEVAAETLNEVEPGIQASIIESLEAEKAAEIIEEMSPGEAAHVLAELEEETSEEILEEMHAEPQSEIRELMEFKEGTAGGMMNTQFVCLPETARMSDVMEELRSNEELLESLNVIFIEDVSGRLSGVLPLAKLLTVPDGAPLREMASGEPIAASLDESADRVAELFDKYNLVTLPVVDRAGRVAGAITADDIITLLRQG